jgi:RNA polymerase sigma-70 factor (ECF subfamily)
LLERARGGDREALDALFQRLGPPLHRWARGRLPGWARGMVSTVDLVQEALFSTFRALERQTVGADGRLEIHAYLRTSLKSRLIDELRKVQRRPALDPMNVSVGMDTESPIEAAIGREALEAYETALAALDPVSRDAVIARLELNLPWQDIAQMTGKSSADAARISVSRALVRLAEAMGDD